MISPIKLIILLVLIIFIILMFRYTKKFRYEPLGKLKYSHTNDYWRHLIPVEAHPVVHYRPVYNASNKQMYRYPQIHWMRNMNK